MRVRRLLACFTALAILAGCTGGSGDDSDDAKGDDAAATSPVRGGTLTDGLERPQSLDPADAQPTSQSELIASDLLFDGLTRIDPETGEAVPALASKVRSSSDMRTWLFRIPGSTQFVNGRALGPRDAKYSIERVAKKGSRSPAATQLELVEGYRDFVDGKAKTISGIRTSKNGVLQIKLTAPLATFPEVLASPIFGIVPKGAVERDDPAFRDAPVGSGPFRLRQREGNVVHLVRAAGADTYLDGVDLTFFDSTDAAYAAFIDDEVDWSPVPNDRVEEAAERFGTAGFVPFHASLFYGFNLKNPSFQNARFREAIVHAIDRQAIVRAVYNDTVQQMDGVVIDGVPGRQENPCRTRCNYAPAAAKRLLAKAFPGKQKPPTIAIDFDEGTVQEAIARAMKDNLKQVGIVAKLRPKSFRQYQEFVASGKQQLFRLGWISVYPAADPFLTPLFLGGAPDNVTGFSNAGVDKTLKAARAEKNDDKRAKLYNKAERLIMAKVPIVPIAQFLTHSVAAPRVHDLVVTVDGTFDATRVWVTGS